MNDSIGGNDIRLHHHGAFPHVILVGQDLHHAILEDLGVQHVPPCRLLFLPENSTGEQGAWQDVSQQDGRQRLLVSQETLQGVRGDLGKGVVRRSEDGEVFSPEDVNYTSGCGCCDQSREPGGREMFI